MSDIKTYDCNKCGNNNCDGDVIRGPKRAFRGFRPCRGFVELNPMKVSLLERASEHDGWMNVLQPVLDNLNMKLVEIGRYPGFKFIMR